MMPMFPRLLRRSVIGLLVTFVCLVVQTEASAQFVTSAGVKCGDELVSFDTLDVPTKGANAARLDELSRLYTYAKAAWTACTAAANKLPGCTYVAEWIKTRSDVGWPDRYPQRELLRALDAELPLQAMRVLAHKKCAGAQDPLPEACAPLAKAEALASDLASCTGSEATARQQVVDSDPSLGTNVSVPNMEDAKNRCESGGQCAPLDRRHAAAYYRTKDVQRALGFYSPPAGDACTSKRNYAKRMTDGIARAVDEVKFDRPSITLVPSPDHWVCSRSEEEPYKCPGPSAPPPAVPASAPDLAVYKALAGEACAVRKHDRAHNACNQPIQKACRNSTFYVGASGTLTHKDLPALGQHPTLCVDTSSFAIDRPVEVTITAYPPYPRDSVSMLEPPASTRIPVAVRAVWPGEQVQLDLEPEFGNRNMSIVRVTVRGYPRGVSLRALAQRGADGKLSPSFEASELRAEARDVAEANAPVAAKVAKANALEAIAEALGKDDGYLGELKAMKDAIDTFEKSEKKPEDGNKAKEVVERARQRIDAFLQERPDGTSNPDTAAALKDAKKKVPAALNTTETGAKLLAPLKDQQAKIVGYKSELDGQVAALRTDVASPVAKRDALQKKLARLCRISKELIPIIDEDVLTADAAAGTYVIDYDYEAGFQRAPSKPLQETDRVYVRVRRVRHGAAIAIAIENKGVVQHAVSLVGVAGVAPDKAADAAAVGTALSAGQRPSFEELNPDQLLVQGSSTQILALPALDGARRYELTVCALDEKNKSCPPSKDEPGARVRIVARASVAVHAQRRLGVRAGVGLSGTFGPIRTAVDTPESSLKYIRSTNATPDYAIPLLLTYYITPRDAVDLPRGFSWGLGAGFDMAKIFMKQPRIYAPSLVLDISGFGFTGGFFVEGRESVDVEAGRYVQSPKTTMRFFPGLFIGLTTDLDIFEKVFKNYLFSNTLPTVGNGG